MPDNTKTHAQTQASAPVTPMGIVTEAPVITTLPSVISEHLGRVMMDRKYMPIMEKALDEYMTKHYLRTDEEKKLLSSQMDNAKLALESLYNRLLRML